MKTLILMTVVASALGAAAPAAAQLAKGSDAPLDITADELEVQNAQCIQTWKGSAEALQETSRLRADVIKVYMQPKPNAKPGATSGACGELIRVEALGSVYYVTPEQRVHGSNANYEASSETITITGDVVAANGQNVMRGDKMVFNTRTGEGQMQGSGKGGKNRPRGVFYPKKDTDQGASKPGASK